MSYYMALQADFTMNNIRSSSNQFVVAEVASTGPFFDIKMPYAAYPAAVLGLSIVFVAFTAWRTWGDPTWKNSALALLYHGLTKRPNRGRPDEGP